MRTAPVRGSPEHLIWLLLAVFFAAKIPTLALPYHWDEAGAYMSTVLWLSDIGMEHALPGQHPPGRFFGHPPGLFVSLALFVKLFGHSIVLTHLVAVSLATASLFLTYRLGSVIADERTGLLGAFLLAASPLFFSQSGLMHGDMVVVLFGLMVLYFHLSDRLAGYWVSAALLLCFKETGVAFVVAIVVHQWLSTGSRRFARESIRRALVLASPLGVLLLFFMGQWATTGRFVTNSYFDEHSLFTASVKEFLSVARWLFQRHGRWILTAAILVAALTYGRKFWRPSFTLFALVGAFFWAGFTAIYYLARYLLPVFPLISIVAAAALLLLSQRWRWAPQIAIAGVSIFFVVQLNLADDHHGSQENDMAYMDVVEVHQEAIQFLEDRYAAEPVFARWPMSMYLSDPNLGYVGAPLNTVTDPAHAGIIVSGHQGTSVDDVIEERRVAGDLRLLRRFERRKKIVEIYQSSSALQGVSNLVGHAEPERQ